MPTGIWIFYLGNEHLDLKEMCDAVFYFYIQNLWQITALSETLKRGGIQRNTNWYN